LFEAVAIHMHGGDCGGQRNHTEQKREITVAASFKYASHKPPVLTHTNHVENSTPKCISKTCTDQFI
jgi:hypothetical protein